jgi:hypothetical protein
MKKRTDRKLIGIVLSVALVITAFAPLPASAADAVSVSTEAQLVSALAAASTSSSSPTSITVTADITLGNPVTLAAGRYAALSGNTAARKITISAQAANAQRSDTIAVLQNYGGLSVGNLIIDAGKYMRAVTVMPGGGLTLNSGAVVRNGRLGEANGKNTGGAGVRLENGSAASFATLTLNSGAEISSCSSAGSYIVEGIGLFVGRYAKATVNGGSIRNNTDPDARFKAKGGGVFVRNAGGSFAMSSGQISGNSAFGGGGGIYVENGNADIRGGSISNNQSVYGGGIYTLAQTGFSGGSITGNTAKTSGVPSNTSPADRGNGGGVFIASGTFSMSGSAAISGNKAIQNMSANTGNYNSAQGGGVYVHGIFNMSGGSITGNSAEATANLSSPAAVGGGVAIGGIAGGGATGGMVGGEGTASCVYNFTGGSVTGNTAKNDGSGIYVNAGENTLGINVSTPTWVPGSGAVRLSGSPICTGHTRDNAYLPAGVNLIIAGGLDNAARIGVASAQTALGTVIAKPASGYEISYSDAYAFENTGGRSLSVSGGNLVLAQAGSGGGTSIESGSIAALASQTFTGAQIKPSVSLTLGGTALREGTDYTVSYRDNVNAGTATVTVIGTGAYSGRKQASFTIQPRNISEATASALFDRVYTGQALTPNVDVTYAGTALLSGTDYRVTYSNNVNIGTANAVVTAVSGGNYTGSRSVSFRIIAAAGLLTANSEASLTAAISQAAGAATVYITAPIETRNTVTIPAGKTVTFIGNDDDAVISAGAERENLLDVSGRLTLSAITLDAKDRARVIHTGTNAAVELQSGSVVTGGRALDGAGIYNSGTLTIDGGQVTGNDKIDASRSTGHGGGVYNAAGATLTYKRGDVSGNYNSQGGGIYNAGRLNITGGAISANSATGSVVNGVSGEGGGIYNAGTADITGLTVSRNTATENGGGIRNAGSLTFRGGSVSDNRATGGDGGGIHTSSALTLSGGTIEDNETASGYATFNPVLQTGSGSGAGVCVSAGSFTMTGGNILNNRATTTYISGTYFSPLANGGGVFVGNNAANPCVFTMSGGTIRGNSATAYNSGLERGDGGGVYVAGGNGVYNNYRYYPGEFRMNGGTITGNSASDLGADVFVNNRLRFGDPASTTYTDTSGLARLELNGGIGVGSLYLTNGVSASTRTGITAAAGSLGFVSDTPGDAKILAGSAGYTVKASDAAAFANQGDRRGVGVDSAVNAVVLQAADISDITVTIDKETYEYTGANIQPVPKVTSPDGKTLTAGKDYTVTYSSYNAVMEDYSGEDTKNAGPKRVIASGRGDYKGSVSADYEVTPKPITAVTATIPNQAYTGNAIRPVAALSISDGGRPLLRGTDYLIDSYGPNDTVGTGTVTLNGIGNYAGTRTVTFNIVDGWIKQSDGTWKYYANGTAVTGWKKVGTKWYYLDGAKGGTMVTGWKLINKKWYYLDGASGGAMATGWKKISNKWYYLDGAKGGAMATGWLKIGTKWYYLNSSGAMLTGTQKIGAKRYVFNSSGVWIK